MIAPCAPPPNDLEVRTSPAPRAAVARGTSPERASLVPRRPATVRAWIEAYRERAMRVASLAPTPTA